MLSESISVLYTVPAPGAAEVERKLQQQEALEQTQHAVPGVEGGTSGESASSMFLRLEEERALKEAEQQQLLLQAEEQKEHERSRQDADAAAVREQEKAAKDAEEQERQARQHRHEELQRQLRMERDLEQERQQQAHGQQARTILELFGSDLVQPDNPFAREQDTSTGAKRMGDEDVLEAALALMPSVSEAVGFKGL
jgi:hypothetical protein